MILQLTEQQRQMVEGQPSRPIEIVDPDTQRAYVLIASEQFERVRPMFDEPMQPSAPSEYVFPQVSPAMLRSQQGFWRDLPELLKRRKWWHQWVCYHGDERIGIAKKDLELVQRCMKRGLQCGEFYIGWIDEHAICPWEVEEVEMDLAEFTDESETLEHPQTNEDS